MINTIKNLINIAETTEDLSAKETALTEIKWLIYELATTYNCPSNWRSIGEELAKEYKENNYIYNALELWDYETE